MTEHDVPRLVREAAAQPLGDVPLAAIAQRAGRRRAWRRSLMVALPLVLVAVGATVAGWPDARVEFAPVDEPGVSPTPRPEEEADREPVSEEKWPELAAPEALLVTDGRNIELRDTSTGEPQWVVTPSAFGDGQVLAVAVRPGSTTRNLTAAFVQAGDEGYELGKMEATDGDGEVVLYSAAISGVGHLPGDVAAGAHPWPVWSPDGDALGWIELPEGEDASPRLRIIPVPGEPGDEVTIDLPTLPRMPLRIDAWIEESEPRAIGERPLYVTNRRGEAWRLGLEHTGEGWALPDGAAEPYDRGYEGRRVFTLAHEGEVYWDPAYLLAVESTDAGDRVVLIDDVGHQGLPLPEEMQAIDPSAAWLSGHGNHVLVGDGQQAWITSRPGGLQQAVNGTVVHADWVTDEEAMAAAEAACAQPGPTATGDPRVDVTALPEGFVQRDTAVDTGSYAGFWDPLEPDGAAHDRVQALLVEGEWDPAGRHLAVTSVSGPTERLCQMMRHGARHSDARPFDVRDRHGLMVGNTLVWIEQPGLMVQLLGNDIADGDFRTVAEGLDVNP